LRIIGDGQNPSIHALRTALFSTQNIQNPL
jgi:hypothetical protein